MSIAFYRLHSENFPYLRGKWKLDKKNQLAPSDFTVAYDTSIRLLGNLTQMAFAMFKGRIGKWLSRCSLPSCFFFFNWPNITQSHSASWHACMCVCVFLSEMGHKKCYPGVIWRCLITLLAETPFWANSSAAVDKIRSIHKSVCRNT